MLENCCATSKVILEEGLALAPPLADLCCSCQRTKVCFLPASSYPSCPLAPLPSCSCSLSQPASSNSSTLDLTFKLHGSSRPSSPGSHSDTSAYDSSLFEFTPNSLFSKLWCLVLVSQWLCITWVTRFHLNSRALLNWENACNDFFIALKDPTVENKKVSKVTGGLQNSCISIYVRNNQAHLTFPNLCPNCMRCFYLGIGTRTCYLSQGCPSINISIISVPTLWHWTVSWPQPCKSVPISRGGRMWIPKIGWEGRRRGLVEVGKKIDLVYFCHKFGLSEPTFKLDNCIGAQQSSGQVWRRTNVNSQYECDTQITTEEKDNSSLVMECKAHGCETGICPLLAQHTWNWCFIVSFILNAWISHSHQKKWTCPSCRATATKRCKDNCTTTYSHKPMK